MIKNLLLTIRYKNLLILLLLFICLDFFLQLKDVAIFWNLNSLILYFSVLMTASAGYAINDLFDLKSDLLNNKTEKSAFERKQLLLIFILTSCIAILSACFYQNLFFINLTLLTLCLLLLYSWKLQHWPFIGNLIIALLAGITPLIVFIAHSETDHIINHNETPYSTLMIYAFIIFYAVFSFLTTLARELVKDLEDIKGDRLVKSKTLSIVLGVQLSKTIIITLLLLIASLIILLIIRSEQFYLSIYTRICFIVLLLFPICIAGWKLIAAKNSTQFNFISKILKLVFVCSIFVIIIHTLT